MSKQGTSNNAKAPSFMPPPLLLSRTVICATVMIAITQESKERQTMPPKHHCQRRCHLLLLRTIIHATAMIAIAHEGEERPTMPWHVCPHCYHRRCCALLFTPLPLLQFCKRARNSQQ
jgi:hypothetical protein